MKRVLQILKRLLPLLISVAVLAYLFGYRTSLSNNLELARKVSLPYILAAGSFALFSFLFAAWRLKFLVNLLGHNAKLPRILVYTLVGHFYNNAIPGGAVGGDAVKALYLAQVTGKKSQAFAAVLVDRLCGLFMLATIALVMLAPTLGSENSWQPAIVILSFSGAAFAGIFGMTSRRVRRWFPTHWFKNMPGRDAVIAFDEAMQVFRGHKKGLLFAMLLSAVPQLGWIGMHIVIGNGMSVPIGWAEYAVLVPVAGMIGALPISFGGWGVGEAAMAHFLSLHAKTEAAAEVLYNKGVVLSAIGRFMQLLVSLLGLAASWALPKPKDLGAVVATEEVLDSPEESAAVSQ
ncbi:MAG: lysylphosphatidylglycerol synthase transmembrane domain-containing protein [Planctomycetota bacterium]